MEEQWELKGKRKNRVEVCPSGEKEKVHGKRKKESETRWREKRYSLFALFGF